MITSLGLRGFKRFDGTGAELRLAPITLIFGANSSGKSSILQSILCMAQSWGRPNGIAQLQVSGELVDLGRFGRVVHRRGNERAADVQFEVGHGGRVVSFFWSDEDAGMDVAASRTGTLQRIHVSKPIDDQGAPSDETPWEFEADIVQESGALELWLASAPWAQLSNLAGADSSERWRVLAPHGVSGRSLAVLRWCIGEVEELPPPTVEPNPDNRDAEMSPVELSTLQDALVVLSTLVREDAQNPNSIIGMCHREIRRILETRARILHVSYICGLRDRGERVHKVRVDDRPRSVGLAGERMVDVLMSHDGCFEATNTLLKIMDFPYRLRLNDVDSHGNLVEVSVKDCHAGATAGNTIGIPDVGSGVAQLLPIVVQIAAVGLPNASNPEPLVLVEQPELHLHPHWQAELAKMFSAAVHRAERMGDGGRSVQIVAETHSEHLILSLCNEVAAGRLRPDEISILALSEGNETGAVLAYSIRVDESGDFKDRWPSGFFPDRMRILKDRQGLLRP